MPRNDKRLPPSTVGSYHVCAREGGVRVIDRERFLRGLVVLHLKHFSKLCKKYYDKNFLFTLSYTVNTMLYFKITSIFTVN